MAKKIRLRVTALEVVGPEGLTVSMDEFHLSIGLETRVSLRKEGHGYAASFTRALNSGKLTLVLGGTETISLSTLQLDWLQNVVSPILALLIAARSITLLAPPEMFKTVHMYETAVEKGGEPVWVSVGGEE